MQQKYIHVIYILVVAVLLYIMFFTKGCNGDSDDGHQKRMDSLQTLYDGATQRAADLQDSINDIYDNIDLDEDTAATFEQTIINIPQKYDPIYTISDTLSIFELSSRFSTRLSQVSL